MSDPIWLTHSRFQHGVAAQYARDRVFLAGDAGHRTLPIGGQGMNAGLHDAVGLAWRLAMAIEGTEGEAVLASYDAERGGEHRALDQRQRKGFHNSVYRGRLKDAAIGAAAKLLPSIGTLLQGSDDLQQLSVAYPDSPLSVDHLRGLADFLPHAAPHAGDRAPDAAIVTANGEAASLFDELYDSTAPGTRWSLLCFDGRQKAALALLEAAAADIEAWPFLHARLVLAAAPLSGKRDCVSDLDGLAHAAYGIGARPSLVLIRPDGHIAFRGPADAPDLLVSYCRAMFVAQPLARTGQAA